jgi:hypothetical protein
VIRREKEKEKKRRRGKEGRKRRRGIRGRKKNRGKSRKEKKGRKPIRSQNLFFNTNWVPKSRGSVTKMGPETPEFERV